jgi:hypothetical protein
MEVVEMAQVSPSKYLGLVFLMKVRGNFYKSETGIEYVPEEVESLISEKSDRLVNDDKREFCDWELLGWDADLDETEEEIPFPSDCDMPFVEAEIVAHSYVVLVTKAVSMAMGTKSFARKSFAAKSFWKAEYG